MGASLTDEKFHVLAVPQIGPGKGDGVTGDDDFGRFRETQDPRDLYAFRTPALLNVEVFGPYSHDGAYAALEDMIGHHLNPATAARDFDYNRLEPYTQQENAEANTMRAVEQYESLKAAGLSKVQEVNFSDGQIQDLVSFLLAQTDPCVKDAECLAPWMPSEEEAGPDGLRLRFALDSTVP